MTLADTVSERVRFSLVEFDAKGAIIGDDRMDRLVEEIRDIEPKHILLMSHGWNNSRSEATASYQTLLDLMGQIGDTHNARPRGFRPFVIGVHWPSKAWDDEARRLFRVVADEDLTLAICKVLPADKSPNTYLQDVLTVRRLLLESPEATDVEVQELIGILRRYSIEPAAPDDESIFDTEAMPNAGMQRLGSSLSIRDVFRAFTFWQMKKRSGIVGRHGGRELIARLMNEFPETEKHLIGHSFGCKLWLSAVTSMEPPARQLDSLTLMQPAISAHAFAETVPGTTRGGGYRAALERVRGPIVVTFTANDTPLRFAYPIGSRLAGQTGELEPLTGTVSKFAAMGAVGASGVGREMPMRPVPQLYLLEPGVINVNGDVLISGHSDVTTDDMAWLIWAAIGG